LVEPSSDPDEIETRLYLIGPSKPTASWVPVLPAVLERVQPAAFLLPLDDDRDETVARQLRDVCATHQTAFFVQDDLRLAKTLAADGLHSSTPDLVGSLRKNMAEDVVLGADVGLSRHDAMCAGEEGTDYVAFGRFGEHAPKDILDLINWWGELFLLPCLTYADDPDDAHELARAGADFVGVSAALWDHAESPLQAADDLRAAIEKN